MSAQHTPAPWHVGGTFEPGTPDVHCTVWGATPPGFASGDEVAKYVHPRDANLIAASPALLDALQEARGRMLGSSAAMRALKAKADAAISRATKGV